MSHNYEPIANQGGTIPRGTGLDAPPPRQRRRLLLAGAVTVAAAVLVIASPLGLGSENSEGESDRWWNLAKKKHKKPAKVVHVDQQASFGASGPPERYQTSAVSGERLTRSFTTESGVLRDCETQGCAGPGDAEGGVVVVETSAPRQPVIGFGAAFTDAAAENYYKLPEAARDRFMNALFGPAGIGYTIGRIPMNSCDFGREHYNFDDVPGDYELRHFDSHVRKDRKEKIPMLLEAMSREQDVKFFISPWSPPAWMKTPRDGNQSMIQSSWPHGLLDEPQVKRAWAKYFTKFIDAYATVGIPMWGLTVQNEPENPGPWEACVYDAEYMRDFVRDYLGPEMRRRHRSVKIMAYDHNKDHLLQWTKTIFSDETAAQYVDGMAYHWYFGGLDRGLDGAYGWAQLPPALKEMGPGKFLLSSESCNCPNVDHSFWGSWARAEKMGHDILAGLAGGSGGWVDWNILLDYDGGPNWVGNLCDTPVYCKEDHSDVVFSPMYYYMGHFSKFFPPGSKVLRASAAANFTHGGARPSGVLIGYETTSFRCENSARQTWRLREDGKLEMVDMMTEGFEYWAPVCLARRVTPHTLALSMVLCSGADAGVFALTDNGYLQLDKAASFPPTPAPTPAPAAAETETEPVAQTPSPTPAEAEAEGGGAAVTPAPAAAGGVYVPENTRPPGAPELPEPGEGAPEATPAAAAVAQDEEDDEEFDAVAGAGASAGAESGGGDARRLSRRSADVEGEEEETLCVSVMGGSAEEGALLTLAPCAGKAGQSWVADGGAMVSQMNGNCMTAGWPYVTAVAARTPAGRTAVVVLNEAGEDADLKLLFPAEGKRMDASIPAHSIQTYIV